MLRRLLVLLLLLLLPAAPVPGQAVRGTILDPATGERLGGVDVRVLDGQGRFLFSSLTDTTGEFELPLREGYAVRLEFQRLGYESAASRLLVVRAGEVLDLEVRLVVAAVPLKPITAVARRFGDQRLIEFYQRAALNRRQGLGKIWTQADLRRYPQVQISHLLRTVSSRPGCTRRETYVDGIPLSITPATGLAALLPPLPPREQELAHVTVPQERALPGEGTDVVDWLVSPESVEGIEIYRDSEIPLQFNPDGELCEVTLIWRRTPAPGPTAQDFRSARTALGAAALGLALGWLVFRIH